MEFYKCTSMDFLNKSYVLTTYLKFNFWMRYVWLFNWISPQNRISVTIYFSKDILFNQNCCKSIRKRSRKINWRIFLKAKSAFKALISQKYVKLFSYCQKFIFLQFLSFVSGYSCKNYLHLCNANRRLLVWR